MLKISVFCAVMALSLSACGGGSSDPNGPSKTQTPAAPTSISQAIAQAETSGQIPTLNRDDTVTGPTTNGVRNDIVAYINSLPDTPVQKKALLQDAAAIQSSLTVDTTNQAALLDVGQKIMKSSHCMFQQYGTTVASQKSGDLEKFTVNTKTRFDAYDKFNTAMSGTTLKSVISGGDCEQ
ncbi:hypothetical protein G3A43_08165 [Paraburkholderia aspalathi]|nr:hypothetical protein [Paraburkholderia aspalathi]MBK3780230.1 hypothetical protein [Paraburkholderia aspalathi]